MAAAIGISSIFRVRVPGAARTTFSAKPGPDASGDGD
jgi:hypothetical protein